MAWYWPRIDDEGSAEGATKPAVGASAFVAAVTGLLATLSIVYRRPLFGLSGGSLVDALPFIVIAWRIKNATTANPHKGPRQKPTDEQGFKKADQRSGSE